MQLKYLKFDVVKQGEPLEPVVIAFSKGLTHKNVAERIERAIMNEFNTREVTLTNGGFIMFPEAIINGRSETANVESSQDDLKLFTV